MKRLLISLLFPLAITVQAESPMTVTNKVEVWAVASHYEDCVGVGSMQCLLVTKPNGNQELFYDTIKGFNYEEGFNYRLKVRASKGGNGAADGSSMSYKLIKILSKKPQVFN